MENNSKNDTAKKVGDAVESLGDKIEHSHDAKSFDRSMDASSEAKVPNTGRNSAGSNETAFPASQGEKIDRDLDGDLIKKKEELKKTG